VPPRLRERMYFSITAHPRLKFGSARRSNPTPHSRPSAPIRGQNLRFPPSGFSSLLCLRVLLSPWLIFRLPPSALRFFFPPPCPRASVREWFFHNGAFAPEIWVGSAIQPYPSFAAICPHSRSKSPVSAFRVASFAPAHVALRAAFGRLPSQRPLACVPVSGFSFPPPLSPCPPFSVVNFPVSGFRFFFPPSVCL